VSLPVRIAVRVVLADGEQCEYEVLSATAERPGVFPGAVWLPLFGTYCSPVPFLPVGEPERDRPPERLPPLVSPSWLALAASLAPGASRS
jgi:hypothetical protein